MKFIHPSMKNRFPLFLVRSTVAAAALALLAGCAVGPAYERPQTPSPAA